MNVWFSLVTSFIVTLVFGFFLIPILRKLKLGQKILEVGPKWHMSKQGTPTMGGAMFVVGITIATVIWGWGDMLDGKYGHIVVLGFAIIFGIIGFIDDIHKILKKQNQGLTALQKLGLQLAVAAAFIFLLRNLGLLSSDVFIPFVNITISVPWLVFAFCSLLVVAGMVNAVNLTDGVDGLCTGVTIPIGIFYAVLSFLWDRTEMSVFAAALVGGLLAFLIFNFHPAKVFMGDTGSLFLGGVVCGLGFVFDKPVLIIIVGAVYIIEMLSVMLQVTYFKITKGKRLFKMSPIHHHFEMSGWGEKKLFFVFSGVTALLCVLAYIGVK